MSIRVIHLALVSLVWAVSVLPVGSATAGAASSWSPGVEGQRGAGPAVWDPRGGRLAATRWDRAGLLIVGEGTVVSSARGAGFHPVWTPAGLLFKEVTAEGTQQIVRFDPETREASVLVEAERLGDVASSPSGQLAWTDGSVLRIYQLDTGDEPTLTGLYVLPGYSNLVAPDPAWERVAFSHPDGSIGLLDLRSGEAVRLTDPGAYSHPSWSEDGSLLLVRVPGGRFAVIEPGVGTWRWEGEGTHPVWVPGTREVVFERRITEPYRVLQADLWSLDAATGQVARVTRDDRHQRFAVPSPDGSEFAFVDTRTGDLLVAAWRDGALGEARKVLDHGALPDAPPPPPSDTRAVVVEMPYMHQLWDTPDDFHGGWSCGPTSCVQAVQKYAKLPDHDITCSWPSSHTSPWGWYVPNEYTHNGYTYDILGWAADDAWVPGAHGFICRELGAAYWAYMMDFCNQHEVTSWSAGTSFSGLTAEVDAGYPMYASTLVWDYGHILVIKGYDTDYSVVVNDPYGDAGTGSWGNYDGEGAVYDWPGYNNGNFADLAVNQLFGAQGPLEVPDPEWDASWADQSYPAILVAGAEMAAWIEYVNEGTETWLPGETYIGTTEPEDRASEFETDDWHGSNRPATVESATAEGEVGRFTFTLRAPEVAEPTPYVEHWGLVQEGVAWFGPAQDEVSFIIEVLPEDAADPPVADAGPDVNAVLGDDVELDGSHSYGTSSVIAGWSWDTPDGPLDGEVVTWSPTSTGTHEVTLTVTDAIGATGSDVKLVTVRSGYGDDDLEEEGGCECRAASASAADGWGSVAVGLLAWLAVARIRTARRRG